MVLGQAEPPQPTCMPQSGPCTSSNMWTLTMELSLLGSAANAFTILSTC